ncbi:MAG: glycosyl transferase family 1 [Gammaproteobacteria bacterium]|nr:MAG: glycosyl transferase family 1 [Gammaproteobacteria bacterium]
MTYMKILWASPNTLLDTANGAALAVREILKQLQKRGCDIRILGGTNFVNSNGTTYFKDSLPKLKDQVGKFIELRDENLIHTTLVTRRLQRRLMLSYEEKLWFEQYCQLLDDFNPDLVLFFDNSLITLLTAYEARHKGIAVGVYLAHPFNRGSRWCRDVDFMFTDSNATRELYRKRENYALIPIGKFINPAKYRVEQSTRSNVLFINPSLRKGAVFVIQLALLMEKKYPNIQFEVVESRSNWETTLKQITGKLGQERTSLNNVMLTPNTSDMRPVYSRARVLLVPSVWWDSGPRVIVEALLNGIPVIGSSSGGIPETIDNGGMIIDFPSEYFLPPYDKLFEAEILQIAIDLIVQLYDDEEFYDTSVKNAYRAHEENHNIEKNADELLQLLGEKLDHFEDKSASREYQ